MKIIKHIIVLSIISSCLYGFFYLSKMLDEKHNAEKARQEKFINDCVFSGGFITFVGGYRQDSWIVCNGRK